MQRHIITLIPWRLAMLAVALVAISQAARAAVPAAQTPASGSGTEADPYEISTVYEFMYIKTHLGLAYRQTDDLDFSGYEFTDYVIPNFTGKYDGDGFAIKNVNIYLKETGISGTNFSVGLFKTIGDENDSYASSPPAVKNLMLDNVNIIYNGADNAYSPASGERFIEVGILCGSALRYASICNIIIINSQIKFNNDPCATNYFAGGLAGDVRQNANSGNGEVYTTIRNISVSADIDLSKCTRHSSADGDPGRPHQCMVGGIVGRIRTGKTDVYPLYTYFEGTINAPLALVGPCYGGGRYDQKTKYGGYFTSVYAGQIKNPGNGTTANSGSILGSEADANRYYNNYKVWHYDAEADGNLKCTEITDDTPSGKTYYYNTRTFNSNYPYSDKSTEVAYRTAAAMASFQGVNHGTYATEYSPVLEMFNNYAYGNSLKLWSYSDGGYSFKSYIIEQIAYDTFTPYDMSTDILRNPKYRLEWTLTKCQDNSTETIQKPVDKPLCINTDSELKDVNRYKHVSVKVIHIDNPEYVSLEYNFDLPEVNCLVAWWVTGAYKATATNPWPEAKYRLYWYTIDGGVKKYSEDGLTALTQTSQYLIEPESTATHIGVEIYDKDGNIYYFQDGSPAIIENEITGTAPEAKVVLSREKKGNTIYFVANLYDSEDNRIAGGCPITSPSTYINKSNVQYVWECTTDPSDTHNFTEISNHESYFKGYVAETYYKVTAYYNGWPLAYAFCGNKDVIFVYDKDKCLESESLMNATYFDMDIPLTTFDGKDRWTDLVGSHAEDFPNGDDSNDGRNPDRAVKTLEQAYKLLDSNNGPDDNIIVVMGFNYDEYFLDWQQDKAKYDSIYNKAATITGKRGKIDGGAIVLANAGKLPIGLRGATKFENISLAAIPEKAINVSDADRQKLFLYTNLHDLTFGENVVMRGYAKDTDEHGLLDKCISPNITIVVGVHNFNEDNGDISSYREKCKWNQDPKFTTLTIQSGCFGRIIGGARNDGEPANSKSHNIFANVDLPHRVRINIDIKHNRTVDIFKEYCPDLKDVKHDIGLLAGGQTDGSVYSEAELSMDSGYVGRFISGNITFGRTTDLGTAVYPRDSYYGSTMFNFRGGNIEELYGGSLGRFGSNTGEDPLKAYFYGRSIINIEGGTVEKDLCGAGAGGVAGVGTDIYSDTDKYHTDDNVIPYVEDEQVKYGDYLAAKGKVAKMRLSDGTLLDFNQTYCEVNVKSGTVKGNIYGAGGGETTSIKFKDRSRLSHMAGYLFGDCAVRVSEDEGALTIIEGNIYGGGKGTNKYYSESDGSSEYVRKGSLAQLHGNSTVEISGGTIHGSVYAAGMGIQERYDMAAMYGSSSLLVTGGKILGNIYGGSELADIRRYELSEDEANSPEYAGKYDTEEVTETVGETLVTTTRYYLKGSGCTNVTIAGGIIGNCIFGGSKGQLSPKAHKSSIAGNTNVTITGGEFIDTPYIDITKTDATVPSKWNVEDTPENYRNFNIYGGGNENCDVAGTAYVKMYTSLLNSENSFVPKQQNPNALTEHIKSERFQSAYMDITYRRFCVYGGGYGQNTTVGNTDVYVTIPTDRIGVTLPHGYALDSYLPNQTFFDIAGGGYSGNVGYWVDAEGNRLGESPTIDDYARYVGGNCKVTIDGYTYARKVIGGGFYGSCSNTNTHVCCGSLRQVYGGSLLGDVHQRAYLQFGNRTEDFLRKVDDESTRGYHYAYDADGCSIDHDDVYQEYLGDRDNVENDVWAMAEARAKSFNDYIFITENIYGGNDVKGIIGTKKLVSPITGKPYPLANGYPLFCTNTASTGEDSGIVFNIYGGTFMGDVYGAGNGHYRGYYVPEWVRYADGPAHLYRSVKSGIGSGTSQVYDGRPMVGNVNINIRGNSETDRIHFTGNFYGGGRECTIGQWNTLLPVEDPRRLVEGGHLHVNFGGYVDIEGNVYLGSEGKLYSTQPVVPNTAKFSDYTGANSKKTEYIDKLGNLAYYHWYYDDASSRYLPGFPANNKVDGNYGFTGEHMFRAYLKNIEMECDIELTFYRSLYKRNSSSKQFEYEMDGSVPKEDVYGNKLRKRKPWIPYEKAVAPETPSSSDDYYDAPQITMTSFFLGGACGSMSNNNVMDYDYDAEHKEKWPSIYRVSLPKGVIIKNAVVMGSQDAEIKTYPYAKSDCTELDEAEPLYSFRGGMVTHSSIAFDLIVYNDMESHEAPLRDLPDGFYDPENTEYSSLCTEINNLDYYTLQHGDEAGTTIYRKNYSKGSYTALSSLPAEINERRYDFTVLNQISGTTAYVGPRAKRHGTSDHLTVVKLGASCKFQPQLYDPLGILSSATEDKKHANRYGGLIYGGCYTSGITIGDVVLNVASDLLGEHYDINSPKAYGEFSRLRYNKGRVFGGGYGPNTEVIGNTYVNLINEFRGMNVFGGGMEGNVTGTANVTYIGQENYSYIYGAIYGGGLKGYVGDSNNLSTNATVVSLYSGNVDKVYGGSCMGDLYGYAYVELSDKVLKELDHLDYDRLKAKDYDWSDSRLIAGTVYGGNDIAGNIYYDTSAPIPAEDPTTINGPADYAGYTTAVYVHEEKDTEAKKTPGSRDGYNGFPLIGSLYGGSNGHYGVHGAPAADGSVSYTAGQVCLATGNYTDSIHIALASKVVPTIERAMVDIRGGTIIDAYTGGNMATLTKYGKIHVNYAHKAALAGFDKDKPEDLDRVWNALHLSSEMQLDEVIKDYHQDDDKIFEFNIFRLFGGNDNATMSIQPNVKLINGNLGSVYSGGNFGAMTYYRPYKAAVPESYEGAGDGQAEVKEGALVLEIRSDDICINNVYGGGRLGNISPDYESAGLDELTDPEHFYGATLNIYGGKIQHIYGGNDVAGYIDYGTNVNIHGAISGDVYCAGNGDYTYQYDRHANICDYDSPKILEKYQVGDNVKGTRYFILPAKESYGYDPENPSDYNPGDAQVIMAINSYRPNVERSLLNIEGSAERKVWVGGNVYCGGNSATVTKKATGYDVVFNIGDYVTLNGVFLGSNGENLALGSTIEQFEDFNDIDITGENDLLATNLPAGPDQSAVTNKSTLYPSCLDLYMRAVETTQQPKGFEFRDDLIDAYIGEFCVGGNRGSMMTDKRISIDFPEALRIYGRIIGGSKNANVIYNGVTHIGGLTVPLAEPALGEEQETVKVELKVRSKFLPLQPYPDPSALSGVSLALCMVDTLGAEITDFETFKDSKFYKDKHCNVYGGCFTSGKTVGGINIDLYSDMINYKQIDADYKDPLLTIKDANNKETSPEHPDYIDRQAIINDIMHAQSWRAFTVVGAGYGADTEVWGNINVRLLPTVKGEGAERTVLHPSAGSIFGGSQEGLVVGNTNVEIRDGRVFTNIYGASEAAKMYGSTSVIVGYPRYYRVLQTGNYCIRRADYMSKVAVDDLCDEFGEVVVPKAVAYRQGEYVPQNVYDMMLGRIKDSRIKAVFKDGSFKMGKSVDDEYVDLFTDPEDLETTPRFEIEDYLEPVVSSVIDPATKKPLYEYIVPEDFGAVWDDIEIWVGDQNSNMDPDRKFFGQGNIYGGGYIPNSSDRTLIGQPTIMRFTEDYNPGLMELDAALTGGLDADSIKTLRKQFTALYGGNTAVMMWDNEKNASMLESDPSLKDHVHIGTGYFRKVTVTTKSSAKGLFKRLDGGVDAYVYQTIGKVDEKALGRYYEKIADGGVYGGGRKVFAQAFRSIDLAYYGYAEHWPQKPKLLNTIQRADVVTIRDCCMDLVGASDFTLSDYKDIYYAINRVGELRMYSSLNPSDLLDVGRLDESTDDGIWLHEQKRSRNFMALYNRTNHLGAFRSNWTFEDIYHNALGKVTNDSSDEGYGTGDEADDYISGAYPAKGNKVSYVNRKHRYIDVYTKYHELYLKDEKYFNAADRTGLSPVSTSDIDALASLYLKCTGKTLLRGNPQPGESLLTDDIDNAIELLWKKRNLGTSGNMIGINSGYELSIEGLACQRGEATESRYYGPAYGITEIKILTTVSGMGGGYIYALNHHYDPDIDGAQAETQSAAWCSKFGRDFLNTTGNFVFPGANYNATVDGNTVQKTNYIIDDCFDHYDPINHGYFECIDMEGHDRVITKAPPRMASGSSSTPEVDVNDAHEIHYWYVSGNTYVYNVTITGITSDTSPAAPRSFYIDNSNGLVNLFNVKQGTDIMVTEVTWFEHEGSGIKDCDLTHLEMKEKKADGDPDEYYLSTGYKLYLTVFDNTRNTLTDDKAHPGAFAIRIPRHSYKLDDNYTSGDPINSLPSYDDQAFATSGYGAEVRPNMGVDGITVNHYTTKYINEDDEEVTNHPLLGVRLVDGQRNRLADEDRAEGVKYYNERLAGDHNVQLTLKTRNGTDEPIFYIINIDIRYLMGPALFGQIEIENCALPGEYIYVNANDVEVLMDENLGVSEQVWRMYPNVDGQRVKVSTAAAKALITDPDVKYDANNYAYYELNKEPYTMEHTDKVIHIPAYLYHDGWEVAYEVNANGEYFESVLPYYGTKEVGDPEKPGHNLTVTDYDKILYGNRLQVHNYHRMKPMYNGEVIDLRLTKDSRIYLESQTDMDYFFEYLKKMQALAPTSPYQRFTLPTGQEVNPRYCEELDFYLQTPLEVPTGDTDLVFEGNFHGMGHNMTIPDGKRYRFINKGRFYNVGFISNSDSDDSHAFYRNEGSLYNCFYFNPNEKGSFLGGDTINIADGHEIVNCYENTLSQLKLSSLGYKYNEILHLSTLGFRYGQAAYNLNGFYLKKRHILLHGPSKDHAWTTTENNSFKLKEKDLYLRGNAPNYSLYEVPYIESYYNNGDYRYAYINSTKHPEALRTEPVPNYYDRLNNRKNGLAISMHNSEADPEGRGLDGHIVDSDRWCAVHKEYHPLFDYDYIFFGQDQTVDVDDTNHTLPCAVSADTRVYRVGGFYGSAADKGYYFNKHAYLDSPVMTAVDFVGYRDKDLYGTDGKLREDDRKDIDDNGWVIKQSADAPYGSREGGWQEVYYPPTIDLPWVMDGETPMHDFDKFTLVDSKVTHNLLVYTRDNDKAANYLTEYHYHGDFQTTPFQYHSDAAIKLHHIVDNDTEGPVIYGDYFHLVDGHDFNAPVAFKVKQGWYTRQPAHYADNYVIEEIVGEELVHREVFKTAWETICLPFDVAKTYAATSNTARFPKDMGEITHFCNDDYKNHEYWLRRVTGYELVGESERLRFGRPTADNRQGTRLDKEGTLLFDNTMLHDLYINAEYQEGHDDLYHDTGIEWPRQIKNYRYLSGGVPYIVTYPGEKFYEFDLSGNFYFKQDEDHRYQVPQSISYFVKQNDADPSYVTIPITDDLIKGASVYTAGSGYSMVGTFAHATNYKPRADESALYAYEPNLYVVNEDGTEFEEASPGTDVQPFHAYVRKEAGAAGAPRSRGMIIGGDVEEYPLDIEPEEPEEEETPDELEPEDGIRVWTEGSKLVIYTPENLEAYICNMEGQLIRRIRAYEGLNRYSGLLPGFYIVLRHKFYIPYN